MDNVMPQKETRTPSPASQLIDDCRLLLRSRSEDQSVLRSLLSGLSHERAKVIARFDSQKPGWNSSVSPDSIRVAAESTLRIAVKTLQLWLEQLVRIQDKVPSPELFNNTLQALSEIASELGFILLNDQCLTKAPSGLANNEQKTLMFERLAHNVQVEGYYCFLRDLQQFCPISETILTNWLSMIRSPNVCGHSTRRNTIKSGMLLLQLSRQPARLFDDGFSSADRAMVSMQLLQREMPTAEKNIGQWEWFDAGARRACLKKLRSAGLLFGSHTEECELNSSPPGIVAVLTSESNRMTIETSGERELYDELRRFASRSSDQLPLNLKFRDGLTLPADFPAKLRDWTLGNILFSSFPQLKSLCGGDIHVLRTTLQLCQRVLQQPPLQVSDSQAGERQVPDELEHRFQIAVKSLKTKVVDKDILNTPLLTICPPAYKSLPQRLVEQTLSAIGTKSLAEHNNGERAIGDSNLSRFVEYLESVVAAFSTVTAAESSAQGATSSFLRFIRAQERMAENAESPLLDQSVNAWVIDGDRHLPRQLLTQSIRSILQMSFSDIESTKGVGGAKVSRLLTIVERGLDAITVSPLTTQQSADLRPILISERKETWMEICIRLKELGLASYPIGRFADSLGDLPSTLWRQPIGDFLDRARYEVREIDGIGLQKSEAICSLVERLGEVLKVEEGASFGVRLLAKDLHSAAVWVEEMLHDQIEPDLEDLSENFIGRLLRQVENDLGCDVAQMVQCRLGVDQPVMTLEEIAETRGITRERVRQITSRASEVIDVRWPESQFLMDDLFEKVREASDNARMVPILQRAFDLLVSFAPETSSSVEVVINAWERTGRQKLTPMTEEEMVSWASREFPKTPARTVVRWVTAESLSCPDGCGRMLWFSNSELDQLLHRMYQSKVLYTLSQLCEISGLDERNLQGRLRRDIRFVEDDNKLFGSAAHFGIERINGAWSIELVPLKHTSLLADSISLESLCHVVVAGLLQKEIADATCWGVHRFVIECVGKMFGATLPQQLDAIVLADLLIKASNGLIRPMRRRRLRWDHEHSQINAKGKIGWVNHAVERYGRPVVLGELRSLLAEWYQDYAAYVVNQLGSTIGEEEGQSLSVIWQTSAVSSVPTIVQPASWALDEAGENVSAEIRHLTSRLIKQAQHGALSKSKLQSIPWMIPLIERRSYGTVSWEEGASEAARKPEIVPTSEELKVGSFSQSQEHTDGASVEEVDNLLARFI